MNTTIPVTFSDLLSPAKRAIASLALVLSDGTPQVTPVWFGWDGREIEVNTARGRVKDKVMRRRPMVALLILDPENPLRYMQIKGRVTGESEEGAFEHACDLNQKYRGSREYPRRPGEVRVVYRITPERVQVRE